MINSNNLIRRIRTFFSKGDLPLDFDIYIVHNALLTERKAHLDRVLSGYSNAQYIQIEKDAPELMANLYCGLTPSNWISKCNNLWDPIPPPRELKRPEIACTASHFYAYQQFLQQSKKKWLLVLEDDAIFKSNLGSVVQSRLKALPNQVDALFVGGGFPHEQVSQTIGKYKNFLIKNHPATNTTVGYLLRRDLLEKIVATSVSFDLPIDYELAYILKINNATVFHLKRYAVSEGSKFSYLSSIRGE